MASARKSAGKKNRTQTNLEDSVKKGLDILIKSFRDDEAAQGDHQMWSL